MGTCTVAIKRKTGLTPTGSCVIADVTFSASYATGGDTLTRASLGLGRVSAVVVTSDVVGRSLVVNHGANESTDPLVSAYQQGAGAGPLTEVAAATNLSAVTFRVVAYGDLINP